MAKKATDRYHVTVQHHEGDKPTHHVGRFASKKEAEDAFKKNHPNAMSVTAKKC